MTTMTLHITNSGLIDKIQRYVAELSGVEITEIKEMDCTMRPFLMLEASDYCSFNSILSIAGNIDSRFQIFIEFLPSESIAS